MKLKHIVECLAERFETESFEQLARSIGMSHVQLRKWHASKASAKPFQVANLVSKAQARAIDRFVTSLILPIVEFFPMDYVESRQGKRWELLETGKNAGQHVNSIRAALEDAKGIYVFYDSRGRVVYVGKTEKTNLWQEMHSALNRDRRHLQKMMLVRHPQRDVRFVPAHSKLRRILGVGRQLCDVAYYFSAYAIDPRFIASIEALIMRVAANDVLNKKMEKFPHLREV
jgi:hypothetical protein